MKKLIKWLIIIFIIGFILICFVDLDEPEAESELTQKMHSSKLVKSKRAVTKNKDVNNATVLIFMNGSDLESEDGEATSDITEMLYASDNPNVNVVIQTMGTKDWDPMYGISSSKSQRYLVDGDNLRLVDDSLGQLDCTKSETLSDFITWGAKNYPADRYILLFWNHGGGPVYGFGYDESLGAEESLTIDEMQQAIKKSNVYFDFIGMDCCLMSSLELCCTLYDYTDYMILSEDFESGFGWSYTGWLTELAKNPGIDTESLAKVLIDDSVKANEEEGDEDSKLTLALIDQSYMKQLYIAWVDFAYKNENALLESNYSQYVEGSDRSLIGLKKKGFFSDWLGSLLEGDSTMDDFYVTDLMAVAQNIESEESKALQSALNNVIVYYNATQGEDGLTGMSVTLPYGDSDFYDELKRVFSNAGFDSEYVNWLAKFTENEYTEDSFYDYEEWEEDWFGWDEYEDEYEDDDWLDWLDSHDFEDDEYDCEWDDWDYDYYDDEYEDDWFFDWWF